MENHIPGERIVPVIRKKLLAKALYKDNSISSTSLNRTVLSRTSLTARSSEQILSEKDLNKTLKKNEGKRERINGMQGFLIEIWKSCKISMEIDNLLKLEMGSILFELKIRNECSKFVKFLSQLSHHCEKHSYFPEVLTPYLEEIVSLATFEYPLVRPEMSLNEAECILGISICKFSMKKIKNLRKLPVCNDLTLCAWALLMVLSDVDTILFSILPRYENNKWDLFMEYTTNPGKVVQNIRKVPEMLKKDLSFSKNWNKINILFGSLKKNSDYPEIFYLLNDILEFYKIVKTLIPERHIKKIEKKEQRSSRSITPGSEKAVKRLSGSQSISRKSLQITEKKTQFLYESRFNKRMIEKFSGKILEKMKTDPDYLQEIKQKNEEKYLMFKEEYIDIHKDEWIQEAVKELTEEIAENEPNTDFLESKTETFLSYINTANIRDPIIEKLKSQITKL